MSSLIQTRFCLLNSGLYLPNPHPKVPKHCQERAEDITACSQSKNSREVSGVTRDYQINKTSFAQLEMLKKLG